MPTNDQQILVAGTAPAPAQWKVPGNGQIRPKVVRAVFDGTGAAGDFIPVLQVISDGGVQIGEYVGTKIVAGGSAAVSWFPHLEPASGFTTATLAQSILAQRRNAVQTIPSGAVTAVTFDRFLHVPGYTPGLFGAGVGLENPIVFADFGTAIFSFVVNWPAANYDRFLELTIANPDSPEDTISPRVRSQVSPDGDVLTLTAAIQGGPGPPATTVTANVFQASGVNRDITAECYAKGISGVIFLS